VFNYRRADLYQIELMLTHVRFIQKTVGQAVDDDYLVFLEHIAYEIKAISTGTRAAFPEVDWASIDRFRDFVAYEVQHLRPGDVIETVSDEVLMLATLLPSVRDKVKASV
jgi:uncharacterized protein with HEPN domain